MLKKLAALLIGLIMAWGLTEVVVLFAMGEQAKFPRRVVEAPWGLRYNDPGTRYRHKSADGTFWFDINEQGMRATRDYAYEKPEGVKRIVSLGDSYTMGYEVAFEQCFSSVLERELRAAGVEAQVLNAGVSGFSNAEELLYLEKELLRYDPDVVVVSFYGNDLVDNVRTGLFKLEDGELVQVGDRYVPAGRLGNFLNSNWLFNTLSARSNSFVYIKEQATLALKRGMVRQNEQSFADAEANASGGPVDGDASAPKAQDDKRPKLAAAIIDRMYEVLREKDIPLVVQSIPGGLYAGDSKPVDIFPLEYFDIDRPGLAYVTIKPLAEAYDGDEVLVNRRSHRHWSPIPHEWAGKAIAETILEDGFVD